MAAVLRSEPEQPRELEMGDLWNVLNTLKGQIRMADDEAIRLGMVPLPISDLVTFTFDALVHMFDKVVRTLGPIAGGAVGARVKKEVLPYLVMSANAERWHAKPRGYPGDYHTIDRIYDDTAVGVGRVGSLLDRCFLNVPAAHAVRNRRHLMHRELLATIDPAATRPTRITNIAAGPARELFDTYASLPEPNLLHATLIDFDPQALEHCARRASQLGVKPAIELFAASAIHLACGRRVLPVEEQDLVYSVGLLDYFSDKLAVKLLDYIHSILRPGGRAIVGNFHPCDPTRALMDHVLDWKLLHRDEDAMHALFEASAFGARCSRISYEGQGINLFAECLKT